MLDINLIRSNPNWVKDQLAKRGCQVDFTAVIALDNTRRNLIQNNEARRQKRNENSAIIAKLKKEGKDATKQIAEMKAIGDKIAHGDQELATLEQKIFDALAPLPNIPLPEVVAGGKENNRVVATFGKKPEFNFKWQDHVTLATNLGLIDYERGAKLSGAKTWVYTGAGALLEWALLNYFIDFHIANGYKFILPPHLLNYQSGFAAGQFPKFINDVFVTDFDKDPKKSKFMLPTAETALLNLHRDEIIDPKQLPIRYFSYTPCYRKEAGSYRTDERGMIRGYQFNKVEMFAYCFANQSAQLFEELVRNGQKLLEGLGLHFQTTALAAGDCSASMAKTYDLEVYIPSMKGYKEVSSVSNATDYQARRANIRTKDADGKTVLLHTLNGSGLATSRVLPAILEQYQNPDGSVNIPAALHKYMHGITVLKKK
ncbi:MAG: serine--tRNA ligase [Clostridia bacterium]|nr:serine--tRNA ligase [Clostridia bacterium]